MVRFAEIAPFFAGIALANPSTPGFTAGVDIIGSRSNRMMSNTVQCRITAPGNALDYLRDNTNWADDYNCEYVDSNDPTVCVIETSYHISLSLTIYVGNTPTPCEKVEYGQGPNVETTTAAATTTAALNADKSLTYGQNCGKYPNNNRIINGQEASLTTHPYQVKLSPCNANGGCYLCGGTMIGQRHVVSAAHCTDGLSPAHSKIFYGVEETNQHWGSAGVQIASWTNHPDYNSQSITNDIVVIVTETSFQFSDKAYPACLPSRDFCLNAGTTVTVSGWGTRNTDGSNSATHLMSVDIPVKQCLYSGKRDIYVCAGGNNKDSCQGDSGGPLAHKNADGVWTLYGIVSHGPSPCANDQDPGAYTRVTEYLDWINSVSGIAMTNSNGNLAPTSTCEDDATNLAWTDGSAPTSAPTYLFENARFC